MKIKQKNHRAFGEIKRELKKHQGLLKPAGYSCNGKPLQKAEFAIGDNDELMFNITCLLKTCVMALEGEATFSSSALSNADPKSNVIVSLEFIINLLPRSQMVCLDKISEIVNGQGTSKTDDYKENG